MHFYHLPVTHNLSNTSLIHMHNHVNSLAREKTFFGIMATHIMQWVATTWHNNNATVRWYEADIIENRRLLTWHQ